jgi:hypothetical protein
MPSTSNVLCGCGRFMTVTRNGVTVEELLADGAPYKLWDADRYECVECGQTVITGFGRIPLVEHWETEYQRMRDRLGPIYPGRTADRDEQFVMRPL